ncbi:hypothetical protein [Alcaligenes ammonioxydans]|uniref:hypothetical protein n=1 Tax=Alcaligenes ammonioxydans TaxID=2582914 RepID=UPI003D1BE277
MNQDEYPGLSEWWVQLRIGEDGEEVLARVYGNTPEQAHSRATTLAAQPGQALTQQTLDDVMAGIPARDAEIEALRKEIETLRAKQPVSCADGLADGEIDIADVRQYQQSWGCLAHPGVRALVDGYQSSTQPSGNSGELPDAARVPLDSLHADAVYLLSRVKQETLSIHDAALSIQHHIDSARAALAQQDAETGKSVSVENQGLTQQTSHHCDDACHEWRQERTPCPDGQCKVRNDAEAFKYWGGKETWVRYLTDHTGLIQITARDIATCNAALDAVKNALSPGAVQQDADKVKADLLSSLVEIVGAVIASDEEGLIEHSETIIKARAAIDSARKEPEQ